MGNSCPLLWSLMTFNADPKQAFYLNPYPDPGSQANADPDPGQLRIRRINEILCFPDPDQSDRENGSGSLRHQAKTVKKPLLPTSL
jgi:hypothetical protein